MSDFKRSLKIAVRDTANLGDVFKASDGVQELITRTYPDVEVVVDVEPGDGSAALRSSLESGNSPLIGSDTDLVVFSIAEDLDRLSGVATAAEQSVSAVESDVVAVVELIKAKVGAHVFIANLSTVDPETAVFNYHGLTTDPYTLRAHRLNLMLVGISHNEGISIIDVDRKIAEVGGESSVVAASEFNAIGCEAIAGEVVRIVEEYGFLDDRPLMEQVGARAGSGQS